MVASRSLLTLSLLASSAVANNVFGGEPEAQCQCTPENARVRYIVVEMPPQPPKVDEVQAANVPDVTESEEYDYPVVPNVPSAPVQNTTHTLPPCKNPHVDTSDKQNILPTPQITLYYGDDGSSGSASAAPAPFANSTHTNAQNFTTSVPTASQGTINMTLTTNNSFVALEYIDSIINVNCHDDMLTVKFSDAESFQIAADNWESLEAGLVIVTNDQGNCNAEFERGFFKVDDVQPDKDSLSITCTASQEEIKNIAQTCEMTFSSLPAATLRKRLVLDPSVSLSFGAALPEAKTLLDLKPYLKITADEAAFESTISFSGYLNYDFWAFKLKALYFDLDTSFQADVGISAQIQAAYNQTFQYAPDELTYSLFDVPGVLSLGPGIAFGIGIDLSASAGVNVSTHLGLGIPKGNVHIDLVNKATGTTTSGWDPVYTASANISQKAAVGADVFASLTVQLAIKLLGGLVDLSSGLTAQPRINNTFTLDANQILAVSGKGVTSLPTATATQPQGSDSTALGNCDQGVSIKSDFGFSLVGFITKYWKTQLYGVTVPIVNQCYKFNKQ